MAHHKKVRWTLTLASSEFSIDPKTLAKRVKREGLLSGKDKCYSTADICQAVFGGVEHERALLVREQRELTEAKKLILLQRWVPLEVVDRLWSAVAHELSRKIQNAALAEDVKQELSADLKAIPTDEYLSAAAQVSLDDDTEGPEPD
jgi:hypothetical protein